MKAGWIKKKLSQVCEKITDGTHQTPSYFDDGVVFLSSKNVTSGKINWDDVKYIDSKQHVDMQKRVSPRLNDILLAKNGTTGVAAIVDRDVSFDIYVSLALLRPTDAIVPLFLLHFINSPLAKTQFTKRLKGSGVPNLHLEEIRDVEISYPESKDEQHRIVAILDEAFDGIATVKANAEKNLQNARALFESHLQAVFNQRGEGWLDKTLDQVCLVERGSSPRPIKSFFTTEANGVNWIKIGDTEEGGKYVYSTAQKITPEGAKQSRYVKEGDFILTNSMSFGRPYIMKTDGYIHDGWFVLHLKDSIDTEYFYYLLSSKFVQEQFSGLAAGAIVKNISSDLVKKAILPIPPLVQQCVLVERFVELSAETQRLESIYQQKIAALDELKKSLLHQAFSGKLTAKFVEEAFA
jgi:type I restriction enzyme S subunit